MKKINIHIGMLMIVVLSLTSCKIDIINEIPEKQAAIETTKHIDQENATITPYKYNNNEPYLNVSHALDNEIVKELHALKNDNQVQSLLDNDNEPETALFSNLVNHRERTKSKTDIVLPNRKEIDVMLFDRTMEMQIQ